MSIFQSIKNFNIENKDDLVSITINENNIDYLKTNKFNIDILEDLVESKAYATAMLYLNENCILDTKSSSLDDINSFYKECEDLLDTNITIVEEKGIPLCDICGYKIYEGAGYILRGNGSKKIKESFDSEEKDTEDVNLSEDTEGVQTDDIASKVDQELGTTPAKPKEKKKYYDILLSGLDESMNSIINKGFMKNSQGQYERNGYILVREGKSYKAINKNKINV